MASTARPFALAPPPAIFQQRRVDVLLSLQQAAQQIASILELDELLDTIVHRIAVDFGCIESSILLVDGDEFHLAAVHGCTQSKKGARWPVTEGLSAQVVATGKSYYAPDVTQELLYRACEPHTRSEVIIPLTVRDRIIGVFGASHHDVDAFPRAQIEILKALAGHIAVAVDNAQRIQHERRQIQHLHEEQDEARRIQQNLLPRTAPSLPGFQLEAERSEEHTSELQSLRHLVCRLLLEKKKNLIYVTIRRTRHHKKDSEHAIEHPHVTRDHPRLEV